MPRTLVILSIVMSLGYLYAICPDGQYQSSTICRPCQTQCSKCKDDASLCTECSKGYYLSNSFTCSKCSISCVECLDRDRCSACVKGKYLASGNICQPCLENCLECNSNQCLECSN